MFIKYKILQNKHFQSIEIQSFLLKVELGYVECWERSNPSSSKNASSDWQCL